MIKHCGLTQVDDSIDIIMLALGVPALAGKVGRPTEGTVDARSGIIATDKLGHFSKDDILFPVFNSLLSTLFRG